MNSLPRGYKEKRICKYCGKEFEVYAYRLRDKTRANIFCSHECSHEYHRANGKMWHKIHKQVKDRDNWTCQLCNHSKPSYCMIAHHIDTDDNDLNNLICLCRHCHTTIEMVKANNSTLYRQDISPLLRRLICH